MNVMDLFVVNRYTGEETQDNDAEEKNKLPNILLKIEERTKIKRKHKKKQINTNLALNNITTPYKKEQNLQINKKYYESDSTDDAPRKKKHKVGNIPDKIEGYTVLGTENFARTQKVHRVLPKWLLHPTVISGSLNKLHMKVADMIELENQIVVKLIQNGIHNFFPVQAVVIPWLLTSSANSDLTITQDVCVSAPTGSGKTLVYTLPLIQLLKGRERKALRALIVSPTQNLAFQIYQTFLIYSKRTGLHVGIIVGNKSFKIEKRELVMSNSVWGIQSKVDILICTPGKLVDHLKSTEGFSLADLEYLVIDEADRVLENAQDDWLYHLGDHIKKDRRKLGLNILSAKKVFGNNGPRKLLFSATLSQDPEKLQKLGLFQPKLFTCVVNKSQLRLHKQMNFIVKYTTPDELNERYVVCSPLAKPVALYKFLNDTGLKRVLIFTGSIQSVHRLKLLLQSMFRNQLKIDEISSVQNLDIRKNLMNAFMCGDVDILVCTDSVARGIDFPRIDCVISYTTAKHIKTYIHRAGRTARAGQPGLSVTFLQPEQVTNFLSMLENAGKSNLECIEYKDEELEDYSELYDAALKNLKKNVIMEEKRNLENMKKERNMKPVKNMHKNKQIKRKKNKH